jgi:hypothetical protein
MTKNFIWKHLQKYKSPKQLKVKKEDKQFLPLKNRVKQRKKPLIFLTIAGRSLEIRKILANGYSNSRKT